MAGRRSGQRLRERGKAWSPTVRGRRAAIEMWGLAGSPAASSTKAVKPQN
jgi:hypothetical protein